jgi:hypothetical protein
MIVSKVTSVTVQMTLSNVPRNDGMTTKTDPSPSSGGTGDLSPVFPTDSVTGIQSLPSKTCGPDGAMLMLANERRCHYQGTCVLFCCSRVGWVPLGS